MPEIINIREQALYDYLSSRGDKWTPMVDVYYALYGLYPIVWNDADFHNSSARRMISADIQHINENAAFEKIIINGNKGVKIATQEEADTYISNLYVSVFRKLKRVRAIDKKASLDGQFQLATDNYINSFIEKGKAV